MYNYSQAELDIMRYGTDGGGSVHGVDDEEDTCHGCGYLESDCACEFCDDCGLSIHECECEVE
jgi:hypothetical protein